MRRRVTVVGSVCLSVKSHLTSGASVRPENTVTYPVGNEGQNICGVFSETTLLQRSSTASVESIRTVCHFPAESAHAHYIAHAFSRFVHMWRRGFCTLMHSFFIGCLRWESNRIHVIVAEMRGRV